MARVPHKKFVPFSSSAAKKEFLAEHHRKTTDAPEQYRDYTFTNISKRYLKLYFLVSIERGTQRIDIYSRKFCI
jgi:hypothetical protein